MQKLAADKGLTLTYSLAPGLERVYADKNKTKQVLFTLLGNAVKFTSQGGVTLTISSENGTYLFAVRDTGRASRRRRCAVVPELQAGWAGEAGRV
jgi:signal transduction histidine kinase